MVEILWKSSPPHSAKCDQELIELRLVDLGSRQKDRYLVREIHALWSATDQQIEWKGFDDEAWETLQSARNCFESRRALAVKRGFPFTTMLS